MASQIDTLIDLLLSEENIGANERLFLAQMWRNAHTECEGDQELEAIVQRRVSHAITQTLIDRLVQTASEGVASRLAQLIARTEPESLDLPRAEPWPPGDLDPDFLPSGGAPWHSKPVQTFDPPLDPGGPSPPLDPGGPSPPVDPGAVFDPPLDPGGPSPPLDPGGPSPPMDPGEADSRMDPRRRL